jgi:hypothetical protein
LPALSKIAFLISSRSVAASMIRSASAKGPREQRFGLGGFDLAAAHQLAQCLLDIDLACLGTGQVDVGQHDLHAMGGDSLGDPGPHLAGSDDSDTPHGSILRKCSNGGAVSGHLSQKLAISAGHPFDVAPAIVVDDASEHKQVVRQAVDIGERGWIDGDFGR